MNADAVTFGTPEAYHRSLWTEASDPRARAAWRRLLTSDFQLAFRTHSKTALLLYADDDLGNFVQLHLEEGAGLVFTFNSNRTIVSARVGSNGEKSLSLRFCSGSRDFVSRIFEKASLRGIPNIN